MDDKITFMDDITVCKQHTCLKKETCFRYQVEPLPLQAYLLEIPYNSDGECSLYWPIKQNWEVKERRLNGEESKS